MILFWDICSPFIKRKSTSHITSPTTHPTSSRRTWTRPPTTTSLSTRSQPASFPGGSLGSTLFLDDIWKRTVEKSQTNVLRPSVLQPYQAGNFRGYLKVQINFSLLLFQIFVHPRSKSSCILFANFDFNTPLGANLGLFRSIILVEIRSWRDRNLKFGPQNVIWRWMIWAKF